MSGTDHIAPLRIHDVTGVNVLVNVPRFIATRKEGCTGNAYVFTSRPVRTGEKISVRIMDLDATLQHSLTFGMTSCDPDDIRPHRLPDDPDDLMERGEYWIVCKDVVPDLEKNDGLTFHVKDTGQIIVTRNDQTTALEVFVDQSVPLWAFFDLSGNTRKIELKLIHQQTAPTSKPSQQASDIIFTSMMMMNKAIQKAGIPTPFTSAIGGVTLRPSRPPFTSGGATVHQPPFTSGGIVTAGNSAAVVGLAGSASPQTGKRPRPPVPPRPQVSPRTASANKSENTVVSSSNTRTQDTDSVASSSSGGSGAQDREREECVICMDNLPNCVLLSCRHMCLCDECAENLRKETDAQCPVCRKVISDVIKVFR